MHESTCRSMGMTVLDINARHQHDPHAMGAPHALLRRASGGAAGEAAGSMRRRGDVAALLHNNVAFLLRKVPLCIKLVALLHHAIELPWPQRPGQRARRPNRRPEPSAQSPALDSRHPRPRSQASAPRPRSA